MGKRLKVMVVEDLVITAMAVEAKLKGVGYDVCAVAYSGEEAIQLAEETRPDLVLMDIWLQGSMDGVEAASKIRARFDIPIIYVTACVDDETLERAKQTEPLAYVRKPCKAKELDTHIQWALYRKNMQERRLSKRFVEETS